MMSGKSRNPLTKSVNNLPLRKGWDGKGGRTENGQGITKGKKEHKNLRPGSQRLRWRKDKRWKVCVCQARATAVPEAGIYNEDRGSRAQMKGGPFNAGSWSPATLSSCLETKLAHPAELQQRDETNSSPWGPLPTTRETT